MSPRGPLRGAWFVCDALGIALAAGTWALVLGAAGLLVREMLLPARHALYAATHGALFALLAALGLAAHARTVLSEPGSVPPDTPRGPSAPGSCSRCEAARPARAHHCAVCRRCVRRMDHHCPWVNNCVGKDNRQHFVLFTLYIALASLHLLLLLGAPVVRGYARGDWGLHSTVAPGGARLLLFLVALKGFLLGALMFCLQVHAICTDTTRIERLQGERPPGGRRSAWANLKAVFGPRVSLAWINPFVSPKPWRAEGHRDVV